MGEGVVILASYKFHLIRVQLEDGRGWHFYTLIVLLVVSKVLYTSIVVMHAQMGNIIILRLFYWLYPRFCIQV